MMIAYALSFPRLSTENKSGDLFDRAATQKSRHLTGTILHKLKYTTRENI